MYEKLVAYAAKQLELDAAEITPDSTFESMGIDSLDIVEMIMDLESELGVELDLEDQKITTFGELADFIGHFNEALSHTDGLLSQVLDHIRQRAGKRMRPILILLMAKNFGKVSLSTQYAAVGLELLHTASLVHDDVVDESRERRGQRSVNAAYDNKVAVLVGDYILSTALLCRALSVGTGPHAQQWRDSPADEHPQRGHQRGGLLQGDRAEDGGPLRGLRGDRRAVGRGPGGRDTAGESLRAQLGHDIPDP